MTFFPLMVYSNGQHGIHSFLDSFLKNKPKKIEKKYSFSDYTYEEDFYWYDFDVKIISPTEVEFIVFDMEDFCYGGRGRKIHSFKAEVSKNETKKYIDAKLMKNAIARRDKELKEIERKICQGYADEERRALGL